MLKECGEEKARGAKSEKVNRELEGKLPPFSWFFLGCFLMCFVFFVFEKKKTMTMCRHLLLWWCCREEEDDGNVPLSFFVVLFSSLVVFKRRKQ
jgi:hypothetical protein